MTLARKLGHTVVKPGRILTLTRIVLKSREVGFHKINIGRFDLHSQDIRILTDILYVQEIVTHFIK